MRWQIWWQQFISAFLFVVLSVFMVVGVAIAVNSVGVSGVDPSVARPAWKTAVVDRIVDGEYAVLLIFDQNGESESERVEKLGRLPEGVKEGEGMWVRYHDDVLVTARIDARIEQEIRARVDKKLNLLRARGRKR